MVQKFKIMLSSLFFSLSSETKGTVPIEQTAAPAHLLNGLFEYVVGYERRPKEEGKRRVALPEHKRWEIFDFFSRGSWPGKARMP